MAARKVILLLLALIIGGGTVFMTRSMMAVPEGAVQADGKKAPAITEILVAASDMPAGTMIRESDLKWQTWPQTDNMTGYAIKGQNELSEYVGTVVRQGLRAGEPVILGRVVKPGERGFMAAALSPGMRAVSISVTATSGVAGFIFPGDRVDVIVTHEITTKGETESNARKVSETILRDIRVLAVDQKMDDQVAEPKVPQIVTLEVLPKQAEGIALAGQLGSLSLALRSIANGTEDVAGKADMTWDSDISRALPGPVNREGTIQKIKIIRGHESTEAIYDMTQP